MTRTITLIALLFALVAAPLAAQETPRFLIERIDVRGLKHASPEIVITESRLQTGQTYSEAELADAINRVNRLPFVLSADLSLEKGSVRDAYVLVVTVNETRRFFYLADMTLMKESDDRLIDTAHNSGLVGFRWFVGRRGVLHLAHSGATRGDRPFESNHSGVEVGYTHFGLFGSNAFASLNVRKLDLADGVQPELVIGVPLTTTQTLTTTFTTLRLARDAMRIDPNRDDLDFGQQTLAVTWSHNTTNHPFFPTRGTLLSITPIATWTDDTQYFHVFSPNPPPPERRVVHSRTLALEASAAKFFELSERNSIGLSGRGGYAHADSTGDIQADEREREYRYGHVQAAFSHSFRDEATREAEGDKRLELALRAFSNGRDYVFLRDDGIAASVNWVYRNLWGTLRIGVGYVW